MGTRARLWDFLTFVQKSRLKRDKWHRHGLAHSLGDRLLWSAEETHRFAYIAPSTNLVSPLIQPCRNTLSQPNGNQIDERATVFLFSLRTAQVILPIPTSMTCMIACTFMFLVFQDIQALKSSEWVFVPVEFVIPYPYLQTRKLLWILDHTKHWVRYPSPWYLPIERIYQWRNICEKLRHLSLQGELTPVAVTPNRFFDLHPSVLDTVLCQGNFSLRTGENTNGVTE